MMTATQTTDRSALVGIRVTLDGKPATIGGRLNQFATVGTLDGSAAHEWSWDAVARVVAKGGKFRTR